MISEMAVRRVGLQDPLVLEVVSPSDRALCVFGCPAAAHGEI